MKDDKVNFVLVLIFSVMMILYFVLPPQSKDFLSYISTIIGLLSFIKSIIKKY